MHPHTGAGQMSPASQIINVRAQVTIHRRLRIGRDGHLDQSEAYDISQLCLRKARLY